MKAWRCLAMFVSWYEKDNKMKGPISLLLILVTTLSYGQNSLRGVYYNKKNQRAFEADVFQFVGKDRFNYVLFSCTGEGFGSGRYQIKNDSLILHFDSNPQVDKYLQVKRMLSQSNDLVINVQAFTELDNTSLPGFNCYLSSRQIGTVGDVNGKANILTYRLNTPDTLEINYIGFVPIRIPLTERDSYVEVVANLHNYWFYDNEIQKFNILKRHWQGFKLQRYENLPIGYRKITKSRAKKMIRLRIGENAPESIK